MIRPPWRGGAVSLPRATQDNVTPKIGSKVYAPQLTPLAPAKVTPWGYTLNSEGDYLIPHSYENNPHFPAASGHTQRPGMAFSNPNGSAADRLSSKVWEENVSQEGFLKSKARILKLLEMDRKALKAYLRQ